MALSWGKVTDYQQQQQQHPQAAAGIIILFLSCRMEFISSPQQWRQEGPVNLVVVWVLSSAFF